MNRELITRYLTGVMMLLIGICTTTAAMTFTIINTNDSGAGSLRQAVVSANADATAGVDTINFNIPGSGVQTITLASPLPSITRPVTINGYSQPGSSANWEWDPLRSDPRFKEIVAAPEPKTVY